MGDGKRLVFLRPFGVWSRFYQVKESFSASLSYEAAPAGFWQNRLDVFQKEASAGRKVFTIQPRGLYSSTYDVISSDTEVLGTVTQESVLGHEWVVRDARTGAFGNVCPTAKRTENAFEAVYEIRVCESVLGTLQLKQSLWRRCQADLHCSSTVARSVNEALLLATTLVMMDRRGSGGAEGGVG